MGSQAAEIETWRPGAGGSARILAFDRLRADPAGAQLLALVAEARGVPPLLLLHRSRCSAAVAESRQLAMYLMHVMLQRTYAEVGHFFGRDRTTVSYACAHIEDLRERPGFDAAVERMEAALAAADACEEPRHAAR